MACVNYLIGINTSTETIRESKTNPTKKSHIKVRRKASRRVGGLEDKYVFWLTLADMMVAPEQPLTFLLLFPLVEGQRGGAGPIKGGERRLPASTQPWTITV